MRGRRGIGAILRHVGAGLPDDPACKLLKTKHRAAALAPAR
jgi:hypothetical protein